MDGSSMEMYSLENLEKREGSWANRSLRTRFECSD